MDLPFTERRMPSGSILQGFSPKIFPFLMMFDEFYAI